MSEGTALMVRACAGEEEHWDSIEGCDCPDGVEDTDEQRTAKFKAYGLTPIPWTAERLQTLKRNRFIREMKAIRDSLPPETEEDRENTRRIIAEWDAEVDKAFHEQARRPWKLGEWFHDEPCTVPDNHIKGFSEAMEFLGVTFRYNVRSASAEINHESFGAWRNLDDRLGAELREVVAHRFVYEKKTETVPLRFSRDAWMDTLNAYLFHREVDPFKEWLEALKRWDGVERLDGWLTQVFTIDNPNGLVEWASRFILLGAVKRTFEPGAKLDEMPVLIGKGGIGKSTALRYILPQEMPGLFSDALNLAGTPQERAESMQGRVIVEASELAGATRADNASLKTFLSRTDDGNVRLAYRRDPELMLRRAIIVGTSDVLSPLPNDRNLRRWAPIKLTGGDPTKLRVYLDANRDQLWAEAVHMYRKGTEARLPDKLIPAQVKATGEARSRDVVLEDAVEDFIALRTTPFTITQLAESIKLVDVGKGSRVPMNDQHRLGAVLDGKGFSKRRKRQEDGAQLWLWWTWGQKEMEVSSE